MCAPVLVLACPFSSFPLLPPGSLPPFFVLVSLCLCSVLPLLCAALFPWSCRPWSKVLSLSFGLSLSFCRSSRVLCPRLGVSVLCPVLNLFLTFWVLLNYCGPRRFSLHHPFLSAPSLVVVLCLSCSGLSVVCCGASCLVCCGWVCLGK